jgi:hypothetical protein
MHFGETTASRRTIARSRAGWNRGGVAEQRKAANDVNEVDAFVDEDWMRGPANRRP